MSITAKLEALQTEINQKILDPTFKLDNSIVLLQLSSYISQVLNPGGGGGGSGSGIDYTTRLDTISEVLTEFYNSSITSDRDANDLLAYLVSIDSFIAGMATDTTSTNVLTNGINLTLSSILQNQHIPLNMTSVAGVIPSTNTAHLLVAADTARKYIFIQNNSDSNNVSIGFLPSMVPENSIKLPINGAFEQTSECIYKGAIYGYKTSGNGNVSIITGIRV